MHILGFLFFVIIVILLLGLSVIGNILRIIFGIGKRKNSSNGNSRKSQNRSYTRSSGNEDTIADSPQKHKKIFDKNEGEYVDFEEMKEENK